ncbi:hypothetical protein HMPREF9554_02723, partial [Treponema phagedenis F0421]
RQNQTVVSNSLYQFRVRYIKNLFEIVKERLVGIISVFGLKLSRGSCCTAVRPN